MKQDLFYYPYRQHLTSENLSATILPLHNDFLKNLFTVIEDNIDEPVLTVGFLASKMAMSKSTLNRRLALLVGLSANEIIKQYLGNIISSKAKIIYGYSTAINILADYINKEKIQFTSSLKRMDVMW